MSSTEKRKRNRFKIECLECGSTFNKDYRGKHELTQHGGEKVRIKHVGAPKNPFEAAIKRSKVQLSIETQTSNDHQTDFDEDIDDPPFKVVQSVTPELTEDYKQTLSEQSSDFDSKLNTENSTNQIMQTVESVTAELTEDYKQTLSEQSNDFDSKLNTENSTNQIMQTVESVTAELTEDYKQTLSEKSSDFDSKLNTENSTNQIMQTVESVTAELTEDYKQTLSEKSSDFDSKLNTENSTNQDLTVPSIVSIDPVSVQNKEEISWLLCAGQLEDIVSNLSHCNTLISKLKAEVLPNPIIFLLESQQIVENIKTKSEIFLKNVELVSHNIPQSESLYKHPNSRDSESNYLVAHDPGNRISITTSAQRQYLISLGPHQPKLIRYTANNSIDKSKQRSFNPSWYKEYPMLEYSLSKDTVHCFVCSLFPIGLGRSHANSSWTTSGVNSWHQMKSRGIKKPGKLEQHFNCQSHKAALSDYCNFMKNSNHIDIILNKSRRNDLIKLEQEKEFDKEIVVILFDIARTLCRQGLPFRGDGDESNGNFNQFVQLLSRHNPLMKRWLSDISLRPYKVTYLGPRSQNEFIEMLSNEAQRLIINDVKEAPFYSVMADTTPDISHKDCLAICVRYPRNGEAVERLLEVAEGKDKTGLGTGTEIIDILTKNSLCTNNLAFQSYDYASNMSGSINGAQANVSKIVGHNVIYIPCQAHRINTFIEHGCNSSLIISNMIDNLESLYVFFSASNKRYSILCKEMSDLDNVLQLRNLSKTRWTARAESIKAVWCSFEAICDSLHYISSHQDAYDRMTRTKAHGLNKKLHSFDFIVSLIFMKNIMYKLKALTETLETKHLSLVDAATLIDTTIKILEEINLDTNSMNNLIDSAISFSTTLGINPENDFKIHHRHKKPPTWLDKNSKTQVEFNMHTFYRKEFKCVLSTFINLSKDNLKKCIDVILPLYKLFSVPFKKEDISIENVKNALLLFPPNSSLAKCKDAEAVQAELEILRSLEIKPDLTTANIFEKCEEMKHILPLAKTVCDLALTAPVSVATNERTFSKLKLIKTHLRSTISDSRLNSLMILSIEKDVVDKLNLSNIVSNWASLKNQRIQLL